MTLAQFTEPKLLVPRLLSNHRESAIIELSRRLESAGRIENADSFVDAAMDHESIASAVFDGVTFPLARGRAVKELSFAAGLSRQGIRWGAGRSPVVHTVVLFAVPLAEGQTYLSLVMTFSSFMKDETAFSALRRCVRPEAMLNVLEQVRVVRMVHNPANGDAAPAGHGNKI
jgi:mannitol/fructose-specific phosphotransferase system IIA component (Ntr-type)